MNAHIRIDHLDRMSDQLGLFEHADGIVRCEEQGYCTDDNARLLVVTSRPLYSAAADRLNRVALDFVLASQDSQGRSRNRMDALGRWTDEPTTDDCWGRALWGLGVAAACHRDASVRRRAMEGFNHGAQQRSRWSRAMAFACIGAAAALDVEPENDLALRLLADSIDVIGPISTIDDAAAQSGECGASTSNMWIWPEPRLRYANAVLAEALIAVGAALGRRRVTQQGLDMLRWLLAVETSPGHLSVTGTSGRGPNERQPQFDQQPIEVAAIADACARAFAVTSDAIWLNGLTAAVDWFHGANDVGLLMYDEASGGGFDGLQVDSVNTNQGAESTLAYVSTMQQAATIPALR